MSYELRSAHALAGEPCRYGTSKLYVRGPNRDLAQPYLTIMGSTEVFGRFVERPFAQGTESLLGKPCVNLGAINAGVDSFLHDKSLLEVARDAELSVLQLMGAQNLSNQFYKVHPRRNDRFVKAHQPLIDLFPEVDFTDFNFNKHLLTSLRKISESRYDEVRTHLQDCWLERMEQLVTALQGRVVLLWLRQEAGGAPNLGNAPTLVDPTMVRVLKQRVVDVIELQVVNAEQCNDVPGMLFHLQSGRLFYG